MYNHFQKYKSSILDINHIKCHKVACHLNILQNQLIYETIHQETQMKAHHIDLEVTRVLLNADQGVENVGDFTHWVKILSF